MLSSSSATTYTSYAVAAVNPDTLKLFEKPPVVTSANPVVTADPPPEAVPALTSAELSAFAPSATTT